MSTFTRAILVLLALSFASAFAQESSGNDKSNREFLKPIESQKRMDLLARSEFEIRKEEFFARPGKFNIFEFDIDVLERKGETISFTPFDGPPIEIVSNGIKREPNTGWYLGKWTGEIKVPNSKDTYPVKMTITTWAVGDDGGLKAPDPNRERTLATLANERGVVSEESLLRINEKLVYSITGKIVLPHTNTLIRLRHPANNFEYLMLYEADEKKVLLPGNDMADGIDDSTEYGREQVRRSEAYRVHVDNLKRELGLTRTVE